MKAKVLGFLAAGLMIAAMPLAVSAGPLQLRVDGQADLFDAGQAAPTGGTATYPRNGELPPSVSFLPGSGRVLTFSSVTGFVRFSDSAARTADGDCVFPPPRCGFGFQSTHFASGANGLSGIDAPGFMFLAGVFLDDSTPSGSAPASLNYYTLNAFPGFARHLYPGRESQSPDLGPWDFWPLEFAPQLRQLFFIGDGFARTLTADPDSSDYAQHQFLVPADATRLFLGFVSTLDSGRGQERLLAFNSGELLATFSIDSTTPVPEPGSLALLGLGLAGLAASRRRKQ